MAKTAQNPVKSAETTFEVLDALKDLDGAGVTELAQHLDVPKSTVHNYLSTLEQEEYVVNRDGVYEVGLRFLELGAYARHREKLFGIAKPEVDRLAAETGELANILVEEHGRGSYLYRARGDKAVQVKAHVGTRVPLHTTALGKAILAHMSTERVDAIVDRHGLGGEASKSISSRAELEQELADVRDRGVAFDDEERLEGLRCVAAPVLNHDNEIIGAISVSGPTNRFRGDRFREELPQKVLEVANVIELNVTYS
ncbi:IclR family transcriptional regulator [Haloarcula hispanica N601]|uniref:IclR family transcriptional regulator n=3 Tax=Haloarcula hispanica TaxID=51589 RepID=A0A482TEY8_HALHI|nr:MULTISPECIES: IclR family transcriptional regulator [Haloarcula]AEM57524.1 transcription regulator [Haloarcula hispanica ATCC 33960]AHB66288.1 IclR family transcriptional regulator [Haloarcula hispanica N601]KAA9410174.1 IclR family transcriptional regulator [Haloarcula hispanica]KZX49396.1 IclR family transcriptional regulator [Haloarcula sp. K1]MCJ0619206.1 IclR family transcriptional regulator [Haloarcula hispanica]